MVIVDGSAFGEDSNIWNESCQRSVHNSQGPHHLCQQELHIVRWLHLETEVSIFGSNSQELDNIQRGESGVSNGVP